MPYVEYDEVEAACSECGRLFRSEEALEAHRREAHTSSPEPAGAAPRVACSVCGRSFRSVAALAGHNRSAHSG